MVHKMKLNESPFDRIKNGTKTIEFRLYDDKRKQIKVGDKIEFSKLPELQEKMIVEVLELYQDKTFENLFKKLYKEDDRKIMLKYIDYFDNTLTRQNEYGHFTSSAFVLNKERTKILMIYHKIYNSWAWTGGHSDGDNDLLYVAMKEAKEETGIKNVTPILEDIYSLEITFISLLQFHGNTRKT